MIFTRYINIFDSTTLIFNITLRLFMQLLIKVVYYTILFAPEIEDRGAYCWFFSCLLFCHSVLLSETLTLLITFEQKVLEL